MNIKNISVKAVMAVVLGAISLNANAALVTGTLLSIDQGSVGCPVGAQCIINDGNIYGSYWGLDTIGDGVIDSTEAIPLTAGSDGGIIIGITQGPGEIDGTHLTLSPITVSTDNGLTKELDFSGWNMLWNSNLIHMGGDAGQGDTGLAAIVCDTSACANGERFTLNYTAHIPLNDPIGFGGVLYRLHLEGTISAVPVPAAFWLFGSGLIGLLGFSRRKNT